MKNIKKIPAVLLVAGLGLFCLTSADSVKCAITVGLDRCVRIIIPSLYAMMAVSGILISSGILAYSGRFFSKISKFLFGIDGEMGVIFLFSALSGYPVGAKTIYSKYNSGQITKKEAEILSGLCFGSGAAFIFGCIPSFGLPVLISTLSANLILAAALAPYCRKHFKTIETPRKIAFSAETLTDGISSAGRSMAEICFCILFFSAISEMLRNIGILQKTAEIAAKIFDISQIRAESFLCSLLDITAVTDFAAIGGASAVPAIAALISFGGICVFLQISAIFRCRLSMLPLLIFRISAAIISFILCRILQPFFISDDAISALAVSSKLYHESSPIPSVMLIFMTIYLIAASGKTKKSCPRRNSFCK